MKKRKPMKAPAWKPRPAVPGPAAAAPQAGPMPDMALAALRLVLIKQCEGVAREIVPVLRHLSAVGDGLHAFVLRVPSMSLAEVSQGLQEVAKVAIALKALGRLGLSETAGNMASPAPETPPTPAPGVERKQ